MPKGSLFSPFLYTLYTSDMLLNENTLTSANADDTGILNVHESPAAASMALQRHMEQF